MKKNKKRILIVVLALAVCIGTVAIVIVVISGNSTAKKINGQLELAEQYLDELDYESAIAAYEAVLEIDPKCEAAYVGLAEVCIEIGDYEAALRVVEDGLAETESDELEEIKEELEVQDEEEETEEESEEQSDQEELIMQEEQSVVEPEDDTHVEETVTNDEKTSMEELQLFFDNNYTEDDIGIFADVTHDGQKELIIVKEENMQIYGSVYTIRDGIIVCLEEKYGAYDHAGGFFAWYLQKDADSEGYNLIEETFGMWQGWGTCETITYYLSEDGQRIIENSVSVSSGDEEVSDQQWDVYQEEITEIIKNSYEIFITHTESREHGMTLPETLD